MKLAKVSPIGADDDGTAGDGASEGTARTLSLIADLGGLRLGNEVVDQTTRSPGDRAAVRATQKCFGLMKTWCQCQR
jgi:hypothetical protein